MSAQEDVKVSSSSSSIPNSISESSEIKDSEIESETKRSSLDGKRITAQRHLRDASEDEHSTRKREREGSLEPSGSQGDGNQGSAPPSTEGVPTKKNRLGDDGDDKEPIPTSNTNDSQAERVGHIRQRVQDLTWQEQKEREKELEKSQGNAIVPETLTTSTEAITSAEEVSSSPPKKQPTFASFSSSSSSPFASAKPSKSDIFSSSTSSARVSFSDSKMVQAAPASSGISNASMDDATPIPLPAKLPSTSSTTQPTFSSFSSTSSPFNSASPAAGPSWLGSNSNNSSSNSKSGGFGGIKPSSLGASVSSKAGIQDPYNQSYASSTSDSTSKPKPKTTTPSLGFGAFAGSSPFASKNSTSQNSRSSSPANQSELDNGAKKSKSVGEGREGEEAETENKGENSFSHVLSQKEKSEDEDSKENSGSNENGFVGLGGNKGKGKETAAADLTTGEESERTVHSARAKLYVMSSDASNTWKERGTGTIRCNVPKKSMLDRGYRDDDKKGARLVMRADGVLRVILNIALFSGMSLELAQDRFVRVVALENGDLVHFAIKLSNAAAASAFSSAVSAHIPKADKPAPVGDDVA